MCCLSSSQRHTSKFQMFANVRPWAFAVIEMTLCTKARSWHSAHQAHGLMDGALWLHASCGWSVSLHIGLVLLWKAMNTPRISLSSERRNGDSCSLISPTSNITPRLRLGAGLEVQESHLYCPAFVLDSWREWALPGHLHYISGFLRKASE